MIKKSIVIALLLLVGYHQYLTAGAPDWFRLPGGGQLNQIKAQKYLHASNAVDRASVIVGSSFSEALFRYRPYIEQTHGIVNLAFGAKSPFDGLEVIKYRGEMPRRILIETNAIIKPADPEFLDSVYSPILTPLRRKWRVLRAENQPVSVFGSFLYWKMAGLFASPSSRAKPESQRELAEQPLSDGDAHGTGSVSNRANEAATNPAVNVLATADENEKAEIIKKDLERLVKLSKVSLPEKAYAEAYARLRQAVDYFESQGVEIILYEMPENVAYCNLRLQREARAAIRKNFPPDRYRYIEMLDCDRFKTSDARHLDRESLDQYEAYLLEELAR